MTISSSKPNQPAPILVFKAVCLHLTRREGCNGIQISKAMVWAGSQMEDGAKGQVGHGEWGPRGLTAKLALTLPISTSHHGWACPPTAFSPLSVPVPLAAGSAPWPWWSRWGRSLQWWTNPGSGWCTSGGSGGGSGSNPNSRAYTVLLQRGGGEQRGTSSHFSASFWSWCTLTFQLQRW